MGRSAIVDAATWTTVGPAVSIWLTTKSSRIAWCIRFCFVHTSNVGQVEGGSDFNRTHAARVLVLVHALSEAVYGCTFDLTLLRVLEDYSTPVLGWSHVFDRAFGFTFYHSHTL